MAYPYRTSYGSRDESYQNNQNRLSGGIINGGDSRGSLMRRFTTNALPTLSPIGQQRRQAAGGSDAQMLTSNTQSNLLNRPTPSERKIRELHNLLEQQRTIAAELSKFDDETRREVEHGLRHERAVSDMIAQSEPTTPPEEYDSVPNVMPRTNRYSTNSLTSPPGITTKPNRSSGQLTSPPNLVRPYTAKSASNLPSQSVPGSRRHSDDEEENDFMFYETGIHRSAAKPNRNSMPVPSYDRKRTSGSTLERRSLNTTSLVFDEEERPAALHNTTSPPDIKTSSYFGTTADGFPKLIRRGDNGELLGGPSAALDLASSQSSNTEQQLAERGAGSRHRISLPPSALSSNGNIAPLNSILANTADNKTAANSRRSMEVKFTGDSKRPSLMASPPRGMANGLPMTQSSYSTNDLPTLRNIDGDNPAVVSINSPSTQTSNPADNASPEYNWANLDQTASMPGGGAGSNPRQSRDFAGTGNLSQQNLDLFNSFQANLQGSTSPNGSTWNQDVTQLPSFNSPTMSYNQPAFYGGYGNMNMLNNGMNNMNLGGGYGGQNWAQMPPFHQNVYAGFAQLSNGQTTGGAGRYADHQRVTPQQRKAEAAEAFNGIALADVAGEIYTMCKDQHGCRFLQRKLEEKNEQDVQIIFNDVKDHFQELMTDPFGNYLCQRLLEYANDEQRTVLVEKAVPAMTRIALNQHGTRALQRMIESISTQEQTNMIIEALRFDVVPLIQDLNGNHVIQKCLNHLSAQDAQFIFDAVGANCVTVGTHRHGCCVLQRCVDHASGMQKGAMIDHIIANAFALVQDPFGNYVVQYIVDLTEPVFSEPLCRSFRGSIAYLSKQKFSSNVIEKCMRCAPPMSRREMIQEIASQQELERLLRDSYANYVVQTAIDFADPDLKAMLIDNIRPTMHLIRNTPHGRRIAGKIQEYDAANMISPAPATPASRLSPESSAPSTNGAAMPYPPPSQISGRAHRMGMVGAPAQWNGEVNFNGAMANGGYPNGDIMQPSPQRNQAYNLLNGVPNGVPNLMNQGFNGQIFQNGASPYQNGGPGYPNGSNGTHSHSGSQSYQNFSRPSYGQF